MMRPLLAALFAAPLVLAAAASAAQDAYPNKPIKLVVPYTAGGGVDIVARLLGEKLRETLGQPVIIDNKPGASGMIGAAAVAKSPADGYTLLLSAAGEIAVNPHLYKKMQYDPIKDLAPITRVVTVPNVLVVNPDVPAKNAAELIAYAKANPGKATYSSSGVGNPQHLNGELLASMAGIDIVHVPYKGAAQQLSDVTAKQVTMTFTSLTAAQPFIKSGQLRPIAVTSAQRVASAPDIPALAEYKPLAAYNLVNWFGLFAPAGTPEPIIRKLNTAVVDALRDGDLAKKLAVQGVEPSPNTPAEFRDFVQAESKKFGQIITTANVTLDK